jgi:tetratricopeptide (TPR) repeat protein
MKRWCGVFFAVAMATACSEYNREAVQDNNAGMALMRQGRLSDARDKFQRAADEDPKFDQPLYNLALVHVRRSASGAAAEALTRAIARNPRNAEYHFQLGNAHYNLEHWEQARAAFNQATQVSQGYYLAYFWQGMVAERLDEPQAALQAYTTALTKAPRSYNSYVHLGRLYYQVHEYDRAAQVLREGLRIAPEGAVERGSMHNVLGNVLLEQGQREPPSRSSSRPTGKTRRCPRRCSPRATPRGHPRAAAAGDPVPAALHRGPRRQRPARVPRHRAEQARELQSPGAH